MKTAKTWAAEYEEDWFVEWHDKPAACIEDVVGKVRLEIVTELRKVAKKHRISTVPSVYIGGIEDAADFIERSF